MTTTRKKGVKDCNQRCSTCDDLPEPPLLLLDKAAGVATTCTIPTTIRQTREYTDGFPCSVSLSENSHHFPSSAPL
ncbi:hypothetical protein VTJ04DRAFT_8001 [Mycothermus thermophilus]|uniref:uncharacterized protein n=1 Tax=Humicola insolens TaxID=85995 RepID=UPI003743F194